MGLTLRNALEDDTRIKRVMADLTDEPVKLWYFIGREG